MFGLRDNRALATRAGRAMGWRLFMFSVPSWSMIVLAFCTGYSIWMYQTWIPAYLEMQQHVSIARTGILASIPMICAIAGSLVGGWFSDKLCSWGVNLMDARKLPCVGGLLACGFFTALTITAGDATEAVILMSLAQFCLSVSVAGKWALTTATAPQSAANSIANCSPDGISEAILWNCALLAVTGYVVDTTGSFVIAFAIGAVMSMIGALALYLMLPAGAYHARKTLAAHRPCLDRRSGESGRYLALRQLL